jgi:hypothetical protein
MQLNRFARQTYNELLVEGKGDVAITVLMCALMCIAFIVAMVFVWHQVAALPPILQSSASTSQAL